MRSSLTPSQGLAQRANHQTEATWIGLSLPQTRLWELPTGVQELPQCLSYGSGKPPSSRSHVRSLKYDQSIQLWLCSESFSASLWSGGYRLLAVEALGFTTEVNFAALTSPVPCILVEQATHSSQVQPASAPPLVLLPQPLLCKSTSLPLWLE